MNPSGLFRALFVVVLSLYPLIVWLGLQRLGVGFFAVVLLALLLLRFGLIRSGERRYTLPVLAALAAYAAATAVTGSRTLLLAYPVLVNLSLCVLFAASLRSEEPVLMRIARARAMDITERAVPYLRRLTTVWALFFALNAGVAFVTVHLSFEVWAVYNGFVSYLLVGILIAGEVVFRHFYKRRLGA